MELGPKHDGSIVPPASRNIEAYNLYLKGATPSQADEGRLREWHGVFRQALALHPDYAEAHAATAHGYMLFAIFSVAPPRQVMPLANQRRGGRWN